MSRLQWFYVLLFAAVGTLIRGIILVLWHPWAEAPDHLAWELVIRHAVSHGTASYSELIHYPHEGGSVLISILCAAFAKAHVDNPLVWTSLLLDTVVRGVQLAVVARFFSRNILWLMGAWTLMAVPEMLPWSGMSFGLHALSSVFPFALFAILSSDSQYRGWAIGAILGSAIWFSYDNILLLPLTGVWMLYRREVPALYWQTAGALVPILALHGIIRLQFDSGFHLQNIPLWSMRGLDWQHLLESDTYQRLWDVWWQSFPASSLLPAMLGLSHQSMRHIWHAFHMLAFLGFFGTWIYTRWRPGRENRSVGASRFTIAYWWSVVLLFGVFYALSPVFEENADRTHHVFFRHFTYVLPALALATIASLSHIRIHVRRFRLLRRFRLHSLGLWLAVAYVLLGVAGTLTQWPPKRVEGDNNLAAGWVLAQKWGHSPEYLIALTEVHAHRTELIKGIGWGYAAALMIDVQNGPELCRYLQAYSLADQALLREGVNIAYGPDVRPVLPVAGKESLESLKWCE